MNDTSTFINDTFMVLLTITASTWIIYLLFIGFTGDGPGCAASTVAKSFYDIISWAAGILTAPPLVYGLLRLLFWPTGTKNVGVWAAGAVAAGGIAFFVVAVVLFAQAIAQYGCR